MPYPITVVPGSTPNMILSVSFAGTLLMRQVKSNTEAIKQYFCFICN
jgi:hypothetical protein